MGLGCRIERPELEGHESGQDHLAIYLHNGNEYLECMLGALKARVAPFNVNYRYVAGELLYLLRDSPATAVVVHSRSRPPLPSCCPGCPQLRVDPPGAPTTPITNCCRARVVRGGAGLGLARTSGGRVERRRPVHPLHRWHDRDAEGRHVAQRRCDGRVLRRVEDGDHDRRLLRRGRTPVCGRCSLRRSCTAPAIG